MMLYLDTLDTTKDLLFNSAHQIYTDSSKDNNNIISAGYYDAQNNESKHIVLTGHHPSMNTPLRAELSAIHHVLSTYEANQDISLFTDSKTSLECILSLLYNPQRFKTHKHKHLLQSIIRTLLLRPGKTSLHKVKAHVGIHGNEQADTAASNHQDSPVTEVNFEASGNIHELAIGHSWIKTSLYSTDVYPPRWEPSTNLKTDANIAACAAATHATIQRAAASKKIQYLFTAHAKLKEQHNTDMEPAAWQALLNYTYIPQPLKSLALKIRMGNLYCKAFQARYKPNINAQCSLCTKKETQGHIIGDCSHPEMKALTMKKHGTAVHTIARAIQSTANGADCAMFMSAEGFPTESHLAALAKCNWFPTSPDAALRNPPLLSKPDIVLFPKIPNQPNLHLRTVNPAEKEAIFLEISYCSDTRLAERYTEKINQHTAHAQFLSSPEHGWQIRIIPILLTHSGGCTHTLTALLNEFQVTPTAFTRLLNKLALHTSEYNRHSVTTFKKLNKTLPSRPIDPG